MTIPNYKPLTQALYYFSDLGDVWTGRAAVEGTIVFGSPGSGKSTNAGRQLAHALLRSGAGGLVLTAKAEETATWKEYAKATRRESDLIIFSAESQHSFDPLFYLFNRPGRGAGLAEAVIDLFTTVLSIGKPRSSGSSDRFWDNATEQLMRNMIALLSLAGEPISITSISNLIDSLPSAPDVYASEAYQVDAYLARVVNTIKARRDSLTESQWSDLGSALHFACEKWPGYDERTRGNILATWAGMADKFQFGALREQLAGGRCTFLPEETTEDSKIVIVDFPLLEYGETGRIINCLIKLTFQLAWLKRKVDEDGGALAFFWADEASYFVLPRSRDNQFQQVCRSARIASVYLVQNILSIAEQVGEDSPGARTKNWLGNIATKVFLQNNDVDTNLYAADLIGRQYEMRQSVSMSGGDPQLSAQEQLAHSFLPYEFTTLQKPGPDDPIAEAVVYGGGGMFHATGRNHLVCGFSRLVPR